MSDYDYTDFARELGVLDLPIMEPRSLARLVVSEIQAGRRALDLCSRAASHIGMFRLDHPIHNMNHDLVTASELLRRAEKETP